MGVLLEGDDVQTLVSCLISTLFSLLQLRTLIRLRRLTGIIHSFPLF